MAQKVSITMVDDLDGTEIAEGKGETVSFGIDGTTYEIDLSAANAKALRKALDQYVSKGRKVGSARGRGGSKRGSTGSGRTSAQLQEIREWAKSNGYEVSERGRIKQEVIDAFESAN